MHFLQAINSDLSVLIVCNKTIGTIKGDIKKFPLLIIDTRNVVLFYRTKCLCSLYRGTTVVS